MFPQRHTTVNLSLSGDWSYPDTVYAMLSRCWRLPFYLAVCTIAGGPIEIIDGSTFLLD